MTDPILPEGFSKNERPCFECGRFADAEPMPAATGAAKFLARIGLGRKPGPENYSRCLKFHMPVTATHHALYQTWDPCFEQKKER